ncbi:hypothetical protein D3C73_1237110 [compost metagenome]
MPLFFPPAIRIFWNGAFRNTGSSRVVVHRAGTKRKRHVENISDLHDSRVLYASIRKAEHVGGDHRLLLHMCKMHAVFAFQQAQKVFARGQ